MASESEPAPEDDECESKQEDEEEPGTARHLIMNETGENEQ